MGTFRYNGLPTGDVRMDRIDYEKMIGIIILDMMTTAMDKAWSLGHSEGWQNGYQEGHKDGVKETVTTITE